MMGFRLGSLFFAILCDLLFNQIVAVVAETTGAEIQLPPITVTATHSEMPIDAVPISMNLVNTSAIQVSHAIRSASMNR